MNKNNRRIIKDLGITFNFTPLSVKDLARYWKRAESEVRQAVVYLQKKQVVKLNNKNEVEFTPDYKKFFKRSPETALILAKTI